MSLPRLSTVQSADSHRRTATTVNQLIAKTSNMPISVRDYGAVGDGVTDDSGAFLKALAYAHDNAQPAFMYGYGTIPVYVPPGRYFLGTTTLDIYAGVKLYGDDSGSQGGSSAVLLWSDGVTGIRVQSGNTSGASSSGGSNLTGAGTIIESLGLQGGYVSTTSESHGIHLRAPANIRDVNIQKFSGDGIYANCQIGGGGALEGQANLSRIENCDISQCRNGLYLSGADSNAITIYGVNCSDNRAWGFNDNSFLGNYYFGCHGRTNASGAYNAAPTQLNAACGYFGCYAESDQPASQFAPRSFIVGGFHANGTSGGVLMQASNSSLNVGSGNANIISLAFNGNVTAPGTANSFGPTTGTSNNNVNINTAGTFNGLNWLSWSGGVSHTDASIGPVRNGALYISGNATGATIYMRPDASNIVGTWTNTGLNLASGKVLQINGTQVVSSRQTGTAANATDLATAITLVNDLKTKLIAHGLIS